MASRLTTTFSLRRALAGHEKKCLLLRGAMELNVDCACVVAPLDVDEAFKFRSSLKSFWTKIERPVDEMERNEFYFVREARGVCTGIALLKVASANSTMGGPSVEIRGFCSTGDGNESGAHLAFKLFSYLQSVNANIEVRITVQDCIVASGDFWKKVGFSPVRQDGKVEIGDMLIMHLREPLKVKFYLERKDAVRVPEHQPVPTDVSELRLSLLAKVAISTEDVEVASLCAPRE